LAIVAELKARAAGLKKEEAARDFLEIRMAATETSGWRLQARREHPQRGQGVAVSNPVIPANKGLLPAETLGAALCHVWIWAIGDIGTESNGARCVSCGVSAEGVRRYRGPD